MTERDALSVRTEALMSGDLVRLVLIVELPEGVHIEPNQPADPYLIPTVLDVEGLDGVTVEYPRPVVKALGWKDLGLTVFEGVLEFVVLGRVRDDTSVVRGTLRYQPCVGGACFPPRTVPWESPVDGTSAFSVLHGLAASRPVLVP